MIILILTYACAYNNNYGRTCTARKSHSPVLRVLNPPYKQPEISPNSIKPKYFGICDFVPLGW